MRWKSRKDRQGAALRKKLVRMFELMQTQMARRTGISPELLNAVEWGRAETPEHDERLLLDHLELPF